MHFGSIRVQYIVDMARTDFFSLNRTRKMISLTRSFLLRVFGFALVASWSVLAANTVSGQGANGVDQRLRDNLERGGGGAPRAGGPGQESGYGEESMGGGYYEEGYGEEDMGGEEAYPGAFGYEDGSAEMGGDPGYDGGYGGGPGSGRRSGSPSDVMQAYMSTLVSAWEGLEVGPLFQAPRVPQAAGPVLRRDAEEAFKAGNHALAMELMLGHLAAEYPQSLVPVQTVKWSNALRRPVWSYRFGVSMSVRGDGTNDPKPIREGSSRSGGGMMAGGPGGGMMAGGPGGGMMAGGPGGMEEGYGGGLEADFGGGYGEEDYGEDERGMNPGGMGGGLSASGGGMDPNDPGMGDPSMGGGMMPGGPGMGAAGRGGPRGRGGSSNQRQMLDPASRETLDKTLGLVAEVVGKEISERYRRGDFGTVLTGVAAAEGATSFGLSPQLEEALAASGQPLPMWKPGVVSLGVADSKEAVAAAKAANIDFVIHFDVVIKKSQTATQNISRCRLINVQTGKPLGMSKGMDSNEAKKFASAGRMDEREYVETQLKSLFGIVDREVKLVDMPSGINSPAVRRRISDLMASQGRSLRALAEVRLYQAKQLISDNEVEIAFDIIGGADGLTMLHGSEKERVDVARNWAAESAAAE